MALIGVYALYYPLSIWYYYGQIIDPLFHFLFVLGMLFCLERRPVLLLLILLPGMLTKESIILVVPLLYLFHPSRSTLLQSAALIALCLALFVFVWLLFGFDASYQSINGTVQSMVWSNLGFPHGSAISSVSVFQRYLHPLLFIGIWLAVICFFRKQLPRPLFFSCIYLAVSVFTTNLVFGWNYESRNFVPALVLLLPAVAMIVRTRRSAPNIPRAVLS